MLAVTVGTLTRTSYLGSGVLALTRMRCAYYYQKCLTCMILAGFVAVKNPLFVEPARTRK